jgi:hypothetical protein
MTTTERNLYIDLMDFYNMIQYNYPTSVKWKTIRSCHFIGFKTVWQRCVEIQPVDENVIGEYRPSAYTILQMINELKGDWYFANGGLREYLKECDDREKSLRGLMCYEADEQFPFGLYFDGVRYGYANEDDRLKDFFTLKLIFSNVEWDFDLDF